MYMKCAHATGLLAVNVGGDRGGDYLPYGVTGSSRNIRHRLRYPALGRLNKKHSK
jgi:hypothetical protein